MVQRTGVQGVKMGETETNRQFEIKSEYLLLVKVGIYIFDSYSHLRSNFLYVS